MTSRHAIQEKPPVIKTLMTPMWLAVLLAHATPALACSVFTAHDGNEVLIGNNEDYYGGDDTLLWFVPPGDDPYGFVAWGFDENHFSQGGMNDQGLFFDGLATPQLPIEECTGTDPFTLYTLEEILASCATVAEAIAHLETIDYTQVLHGAQLMFADRHGDAAIFEGDEVIYPEQDTLFALNFYWSNPELGNYPDWREPILTEMMADGLEISVDYFTDIADAVHQGTEPGPDVYTRYTTIGDLQRGELTLYYDLDFEYALVFDLEEELALEEHEFVMADLFAEQPTDDDDDDSADDDDTGDDDTAPAADDDTDEPQGEACACTVVRGSQPWAPGAALLGWIVLIARRRR